MPMTAQEFMQRIMDATYDQKNVRYTAPEVIRYANDGQRDIAIWRPDTFTVTAAVPTVAGARQTLPTGSSKVIRFVGNASGKPVRVVNHEVLDAALRDWQTSTQSGTVKNVTYDERSPLEFYVYPPSDGTAQVVLVRAVAPTDIPTPSGNTKADCTGSLSVPDTMTNALQDYTLFRIFRKDSGVQENRAKADYHYGLYAAAMGIELKGTQTFGPNANSPVTPPVQAVKPVARG